MQTLVAKTLARPPQGSFSRPPGINHAVTTVAAEARNPLIDTPLALPCSHDKPGFCRPQASDRPRASR